MKLNLPFFNTATSASTIEQWRVHEVYQAHQKQSPELVFLDVREPDEWASGVIPGAQKISLNQVSAHLSQLDPDKQHILICRSGNRSQMAAKMMERAGFQKLVNFQGGMMAWHRAGYPTV